MFSLGKFNDFTDKALTEIKNLGVTHIWVSSPRVGWIRTPLGGFINHSEAPNSFIYTNIDFPDGNQRELYTTRPIKKGEEITVFYTVGYDDIIK